MGGRLGAWLMSRTPRERRHMALLALLVAGYGGHYLVWCWPQPWYIEDAAISFSYAKNLVDGEGLVAYPGGERVEGYSNALWTFLMAAWHVVGVTPWISAKVMGFVFGAGTLPLTWLIARRAMPEEPAEGPPHWTVLPSLLLAASTQFVLWNDSGLENSLFNFLLALGIWRLCVEIQDGRRAPWSALVFFGLSMTRPDGVAYAALGGVARLLGTLRNRQWAALPLWILVFAVPYGLYNWWRYEYFAWWYPNTYYAKQKNFQPFNFNAGGWKQFKEWTVNYFVVGAIPITMLAMLGLARWRKWLTLGLCLVLAGFIAWNGRDYLPASVLLWWSPNVGANWQKITVWYILALGVLFGLLTLPRKGWEARALLWASFCTGIFFWVWSFGDWMKGYRWGSQLSVPVFTLAAMGIGMVADALPAAAREIRGRVRFGTLYAVLLAIILAAPNIKGSYDLGLKPETSPNSVHRRVNYMQWVQRRLGLEHVTLMDVDMGAHMWWSGFDMVDMAGLVDVPVARHDWENEFIDDYVFAERNPEFAHVHGSWANTTRIPKRPQWKQRYFEIPGYPTGGRTLHVGNHVRKDLLTGATYNGPTDHYAHFATGITLAGWSIPAPKIASGGKLYVDTAWYAEKRESGFRVLAVFASVSDPSYAYAAEVAPGYDWYRPEQWKPTEFVWGRWSVPVPESIPQGTYDFGFVLLDEKTGAPLPVEELAADGTLAPPATQARYMLGEWFTGQKVEIGTSDFAAAAATEVYNRALTEATNGACDDARETFRTARRHVPRNEAWAAARSQPQSDALVSCYLRAAQGAATDLERAALVATARQIDHRHPDVESIGAALGQTLTAAGDAAAESEDWETAFTSYLAALSVDPSLAWTRRKAEDARDHRLHIGAYKEEKPVKKAPRAPPAEAQELEKLGG